VRHAQAETDAVIGEVVEAVGRHDRAKKGSRMEGRKTSLPSAGESLGRGFLVGAASALALAGVQAFASVIASLASALPLAGVHALAIVLALVGVVGELAGGGCLRDLRGAVGGGGVEANDRARHEAGEGDSGEQGLGILSAIFHGFSLVGGDHPVCREEPRLDRNLTQDGAWLTEVKFN
jgi:hypothetical protein